MARGAIRTLSGSFEVHNQVRLPLNDLVEILLHLREGPKDKRQTGSDFSEVPREILQAQTHFADIPQQTFQRKSLVLMLPEPIFQ